MLLKNKRLLILGANAETAVIVRKAQKLGVNTHVMDHVPDSPAKRISDGAYDIDGSRPLACTREIITSCSRPSSACAIWATR